MAGCIVALCLCSIVHSVFYFRLHRRMEEMESAYAAAYAAASDPEYV